MFQNSYEAFIRHIETALSLEDGKCFGESERISQNEFTRERQLEETLIVRYLPFILEVTDKLFICERITDIKRIDGERKHELTIEVVTFEQAHSPPYDLFRVTLTDTPDGGINVTNVKREKNISTQQLNKHCGFK